MDSDSDNYTKDDLIAFGKYCGKHHSNKTTYNFIQWQQNRAKAETEKYFKKKRDIPKPI